MIKNFLNRFQVGRGDRFNRVLAFSFSNSPSEAQVAMSLFQDYEEDLLGIDAAATLINFSIRYGFNDDFAKHKLHFLSRVWIEFVKKLDDEDDTLSVASSTETYMSEFAGMTQIIDPYEIAKCDLGYSLEDSLSLSAYGY